MQRGSLDARQLVVAVTLTWVFGAPLGACGDDDDATPATGEDGGGDGHGPDGSTARARKDAGSGEQDPAGDDVASPVRSACALDAEACPKCERDEDCGAPAACETVACAAESKRCEYLPLDDGTACKRDAEDGVCVTGACVECRTDEDCGAPSACKAPYCDPDGTCQMRTRVPGAECSGGFCNADAECVECALDENCGEHGKCTAEKCGCQTGFVANTSATGGCNFDECALVDDNRCAVGRAGNACSNTDDGYECSCDAAAEWKRGGSATAPQCYQGGGGETHTVPNGATWNVAPTWGIVCSMAFADPPMTGCPLENGVAQHAQLTWLNVCGIGAPPCNAIDGNDNGLLSAALRRVTYSGPLEEYGDPGATFDRRVEDPAVGDVIVVETLTATHIMHITAISGAEMTYEWATVGRDSCYRPGGASCLASCGCPGGN